MWNIVTGGELEQALVKHGIAADRSVVLYSRTAFAAARAGLICLYAGVADVRILDGGIAAWIAAGYDLETSPRTPAPVEDFGAAVPARPEYIYNLGQVTALLADQDAILACVRSWDEYVGSTSGYSYVQPRGRIAGSVWAGEARPGLIHTRERALRSADQISAFWAQQGIESNKKIVFYCGTGWRASEAFFHAYQLGWERIAIYDGGWLEWSALPEMPVERGVPNVEDQQV